MSPLRQLIARIFPRGYYILEPDVDWVRPGEIPIEKIVERVYGRRWSSLTASSIDEVDGTLPNGVRVEIDFRDRDDYEYALEEFDSRELDLGIAPNGKRLLKEGLTAMEYWLSISTTTDREAATHDKFTAMGQDLQGAIVHSYDGIVREGTPGLRMVVADLIRRGELPRGRFLFRHSW